MVSSRACRYDRVKILVTTFTYPPYADGCSEAVSVLTRGLVRLGHAPVSVAPLTDALGQGGAPVTVLDVADDVARAPRLRAVDADGVPGPRRPRRAWRRSAF